MAHHHTTADTGVLSQTLSRRSVAANLAVTDDDESVYSTDKLPYSKWRCIALVATVTGASFSNTLSSQAVVIILPTIGSDLGIPYSRQQWIVSAYSLTFGCFLLLWGRIGDVFDKKTVFLAGSVWVTAMTVANPFVRNEGAAANVPTAIGILGTTFPPGKAKNYAFAAYGAGAPLGSIFGNLIGGLITSYVDWKWVFGVLAIMVAVITVAGFLIIPSHPPLQPASANSAELDAVPAKAALASIDWVGALIITLGLVGLLFALTEENVVGWSTPWVGVIIGLSVLLMVVFVFWQLWLERPHNGQGRRAGQIWPPPPLVRMSIFTKSHESGGSSSLFVAALVIMAFFFSSFNGFLVYATYFFQDYQDLSAIQTTLRFIPTGVAGLLTCFGVAQLLSRVPTYLLLLFGNACVGISNLLMAVPIPAESTSYFAYSFEAMVISVLGADTAWPSLALFVSHALPSEDQAMGGALVNAAGQIGRAIGLAVATAIQTAVMASSRGRSIVDAGPVKSHEHATLIGFRAANWFNFALSIAAILVVLVAFRGSGIVGRVPSKPSARPLRASHCNSPSTTAKSLTDTEIGVKSPIQIQDGHFDEI
ncbi:major facilitator superfamily MFS-1 [Grosmannia clavigera kw1407]|uniref:Major facilitator superfamily MFS-1 n=1 Tax=Grosmannia clavigera (strain kw1407 / UAMH 11150) TaxID=655863 RepID=F0XPA2_GROCL|nr:major facilitator superfamily MFS-1 [Grosmannia clavigera kw1407]EFX00209.1 major facilitator superfamily MFS-1 [Grosmannia clavigera kw1407]